MFIQTRPVRLYAQKFITDLVIRSDLNPKKFTAPFRGMNDIYLKFNSKETTAGLEMLFEKQMDFDADKIKPTIAEQQVGDITIEEFKELIQEDSATIEYSPAKHKLDFPHYIRRIEDIHEYYLESYLGNVVFNVRNKTGGIKEYEQEHRDSWSFVSDGDNGEEVTESADLLVGQHVEALDAELYNRAMAQLPFVVKRLWSFSKLMRINVLGYIQSFILAEEANSKALENKTSTATLKWNDVIRVGVYACDAMGRNTKLIDVSMKHQNAYEMFRWITGNYPIYKSFYKNYRNFRLFCKTLNIDLVNDDLSTYDKEFIDSLKILTVTPNDMYDSLVADAIKKNEPPKSMYENVLMDMSPNGDDSIYNTIRVYNDFILSDLQQQRILNNMSGADRENIERTSIDLYARYLARYGYPQLDINKVTWEDGFMFYNGNAVKIHTSFIDSGLTEEGSNYNFGLISDTGSIVKLTNTFRLDRILLMDAYSYILPENKDIQRYRPKWEQLAL